MRIVVVGGSGLIGAKLVEKLRSGGHETLAASPASGVDTVTAEGLPEVLEGVEVVVDVTNAPPGDDASVLHFFRTSSRNLLAAENSTGVDHHVVLSVVGAERLQDSAYFRAKLDQEAAVRGARVPHTVVRATQFLEFIARIADAHTDGHAVRLPPVFVQPEAADDVAAVLAEVAVSPPVDRTIELAGPERFRLDDLVGRVLASTGDPRRVTADLHARYFGAALDEHALLPGADARIAPTRFEDWLRRTASS
jgi:uncharacterized protein YbjT (DUF2867 family)